MVIITSDKNADIHPDKFSIYVKNLCRAFEFEVHCSEEKVYNKHGNATSIWVEHKANGHNIIVFQEALKIIQTNAQANGIEFELHVSQINIV